MTKYKIIPYEHYYSWTTTTYYKIKAKYRWLPFYITIKKKLYTIKSAERYLDQIRKNY